MNQTNQQSQRIEEMNEDEIDLRELWQTILKGKKVVVSFVIVTTLLALISALKQPNVYQSKAVLIPTETEQSPLGSLGGLAAMAGVSLGGGSMTPDTAFQSMLDNYEFMKSFVTKNKIVEHYQAEDVDKNYVFALGFSGIYDLFNSRSSKHDLDAVIHQTILLVKQNFSISSDKKTALITISYSDYDKSYAPKVITAFLKDASQYLIENDLANINNRLKYFEEELSKVREIELRKNLSMLISKILEKKIMTKSKQYYQCDALTFPSEPYIKDKVKPKRALIVIVGMILGLIMGVFLVFFLEFLKNEEHAEIPKIQ